MFTKGQLRRCKRKRANTQITGLVSFLKHFKNGSLTTLDLEVDMHSFSQEKWGLEEESSFRNTSLLKYYIL